MAAPPTLPPMVSTDSFNPDFNNVSGDTSASANGNGPIDGPVQSSPTEHAMQTSAPATQPHEYKQDPDVSRRVQEVLHSDIGINTLLNRLKASIASARDFASCLKRRGQTEEEHAASLKKLSNTTLHSLQKGEGRHESFSTQFEAVMRANERIADNGTQFGLALHAMHENLLQLATKMDGSRKSWKQQGLAMEQKVIDAERLAEKAKSKYDQLAEDLDRVKTGDTGAGRKFGLKGPKSAAQHEEDLQRKVRAADEDYVTKVQAAQSYRKELVSTNRPQAVTALVDLIKEIDAALTMEMQKYASFNEKLVVNNGQVVSPQPLKGSTAQTPPSINQLIYQINNDKDFDDYMLGFASKVPSDRSSLQYIKHPTQNPLQAKPTPPSATVADRRGSSQIHTQPPPAFGLPKQDFAQSPAQHQPPAPLYDTPQQPSYQTHNTAFSQQQHPPQQPSQPPSHSQYDTPTYSPIAANPYSQPDHSRGPSAHPPAHPAHPLAQKSGGGFFTSSAPPVNPVFGISLDQLFARDGSPVPLVVYQCIQAVDLYGLEVEGIYRIPGTSSHIQAMKNLFDRDAGAVDFRNPEAFQHDVNSVAGLLKQFFRELPDPLLTAAFYSQFIDAARMEDETMRRDSMHAHINALPDSNYATLRAIMLHLHRVEQASEVNRMSTANLGICWAPSIMGPHQGSNMADAGLQARVIMTILDNTLQIFDED